MTIPNAEHLLEQADRLITSSGLGAPRQADLRRAVSSAYYGVFHMVLAAAADQFIGRARRRGIVYGLCYRRIDHSTLRNLCNAVKNPTLSMPYRQYEPRRGFSPNLKSFAASFVELQQGRHAADYDPMIRLSRSDARLAVRTARTAMRRFSRVPARQRAVFLALLLFPPR